MDLIHDVPTVAELAQRLAGEYLTACDAPDRGAFATELLPERTTS